MQQDPKTQSQSGDAAEAVGRLVDEQGGRLYQLALRFCGNPDEAEDLVQEVFLQAFRAWDGFRGASDASTWLYRIAARACQRMHRKRSGEPEHLLSTDTTTMFDRPLIGVIPDDQEPVLQQQIHAEAREKLETEIARLPDDFRVPLVLKEIAGLSVEQVSDVLGLAQGTVRSRLHRARLKLRDAIDSAIPRDPTPAPPPRYDMRTCLDLLDAKQQSLDRGMPFDNTVICERCRSMFASLDLTQSLCHEIGAGRLPAGLRARLADRLESMADPS